MKKQLYVRKDGFISSNTKTKQYNKSICKWEDCDAVLTIIEAIPSQQKNDEGKYDFYQYWATISESPIFNQVGTIINTDCIKTLEVLWDLGVRWESDNSFEN